MSELIYGLLVSIGFLLLGGIFIHFSSKQIKKFKSEKFNPFTNRSENFKSVLKADVYIRSYVVFIVGIILLLIGLFLLFATVVGSI